MPYFLIALLVVATVFLIMGLIGRGVEAGSGSFSIKVEGKVGPFPRMVLLVFSAINYVAALVLFVAMIGLSNSPSKPGNDTGNIQQAGSTSPSQVTIEIADQLAGTEYAEDVAVNIEGGSPVSLSASLNDPSPYEYVTLAAGEHAYQITVEGVTTYDYRYDYSGQGTIIAEQGNSYDVVLDTSTGVAGLQPG
jgi:hypothetical protein